MDKDQPKPKELSKDLILNLRQKKDSSIKLNGVLQILDMKEDGSFMTLSDGYSYSEVALFKTIRPKIKSLDIRQYDILAVTMLLHKETINVVVNFDLVYSNVIQTIGKPMDFASYTDSNYSNPMGDNKLPRSLWVTPDQIPKSGFTTGGNPKPVMGKGGDDDDEYTPISLLTPGTNSWQIKARVTKKGAKKEFASNKGGKGCVFNCVLIDNSGEVQATFFTEAAEKFFNYIVENNVYIFMNGEIRKASQFNNTSNPVELHFSVKAEIQHVEDDGKIDNVKFNFVKIGDIPKRDLKSGCDIVGIISDVADLQDITLRNGETKQKRVIKIKDDSLYEIEVNLWGELATNENMKVGTTMILTDLTISEYKGRVLNSKGTSKVITQLPDFPRVRELILFRNQMGKNPQVTESIKTMMPEFKPRKIILVTVSHYKKVADDVLLNDSDKKDYYSILGTIVNFGNSFFYDKCPNENCFKKCATEESNPNVSDCSSCGTINKPPVPRFIGHVKIADHTGNVFLNFNTDQVGQALYDKSAQELKEIQLLSKDDFNSYCKTRANHQFIFRVYAKKEYYNGEMRVKYHIAALYELGPEKIKQCNLGLANTIRKYKKMLQQAM